MYPTLGVQLILVLRSFEMVSVGRALRDNEPMPCALFDTHVLKLPLSVSTAEYIHYLKEKMGF